MSTAVAKKENNKVGSVTASPAERFTQAVQKEFPNGGGGKLELTAFQRKLIQNYFIKIDGVLKESEVKRMAKSEQYRDNLEYSWQNINMHKLAQDVVAYSSIGLDPLQKNQINPIPYKNSKTNEFDITFIEGFNGLELKARKYGFEVPDDVLFELKYSTDTFKSYKKNLNNKVENYDFEINNDFDRGELEGGFYYMMYADNPEKNKLVVMSRAQIEKRRPEYAAAEFWGGEKDEWKDRKKTGNKVKVDGWEEEMFLKTLKRHCWNSVNIDSQKIDDHLLKVIENESQSNERSVAEQIQEGRANSRELSISDEDVIYEEVGAQNEPAKEERPELEMSGRPNTQPEF